MRRFELVEGTSNKFWEVEVSGNDVTTRWGRIGTAGQSKTKTFAGPAAAQREHDDLVREKLAKGYHETGVAASAPPLPPAVASVNTSVQESVKESTPKAPKPEHAEGAEAGARRTAASRAEERGGDPASRARAQGASLPQPRPETS